MNEKVTQAYRAPKEGDRTFFLCGACRPISPMPFIPIVIIEKDPRVIGMHCPNCGVTYDVVDGRVQLPDGGMRAPELREPTRQEFIARAERELGEADLDDGC